jgi:mono/diheme cytochrome c family protein
VRGFIALLALLLPATAWAAQDNFVQVERGRYLVTAGDCMPCHTVPGGTPYAGGRGLATPFGTINSANITPDLQTGIGAWSEDDFVRALHEGRRPDGNYLYPAFPYPSYTKISRADADDIYAFLRTLPAVANAVNRDTLPFPFDLRISMLGWNALFFKPGRFVPDPKQSAEYNRGAYLVEGLGHCGSCHTPINTLGGTKGDEAYQGGLLQAWLAPNITDDLRVGLGKWSADDVVQYLKTGRNLHSQASGPMAEVVAYSTSQMTDADLRAMATYLKARGPGGPPAPAPLAADNPQMKTGSAIYADACSACHKRDGTGVQLMFPPLAGGQVVQQPDPTTLIRIVVQGVQAVATDAAPTAPAMPAFGWRLSDDQVAAVLSYVRNSWGNAAPAVSAEQVRKLRPQLAQQVE